MSIEDKSEISKLVVSCENADEIVGAFNAMVPRVPKQFRQEFNSLKLELLQQFGKEGLYERVNNQSVLSMLEQYSATRPPIESGEVDGVKFKLFERAENSDDD